ncbi:MAG: sarcosine oxidase subunit gamma [Pseudorhodobacter sp.]|nr:sarcosine oxidase subunit gamma [Pseudorhodobacter sp.]
MTEHRLQPITPLGHFDPETVTIGPVTIIEVVSGALASLASRRGREADVAVVAKALDIPLPGPNGWASGAVFAAFWLGPEQWMIEAPFASHQDIVARLRPGFGDAASITEQTDGWVRFDLAGTRLPALFERLCALDTSAMQPGSASRTVIDHLGCNVLCRAPGAFSVIGPRSAAQSLHHALITAAKSVF